ncbi:hypothetical protein [Bradyrhizobium sp. CCBAU 53338]|uniref:hypothetical protein n=1 Tax=Bradyrhizobium sp. CCBAU 53338 TaxID=1325111 RepID=UPI001889D6A5|nr:hypothetical protein [Bradyrhizobium sp. CCBAU 53338]QOZ54656.1 hypothetical protein XH90_27230 [Bradyrhizobium sp. CCBAU 53338]
MPSYADVATCNEGDAGATVGVISCGGDASGRLNGIMRALKLDRLGGLSEDEVVLSEAKPNPFLYSWEASRAAILSMLGLSAFLVVVLMLTKGGHLIFLLKVLALLDLIVFSIFLLLIALLARGLSFVLTNRNIRVRAGRKWLGVPLEEIKSVEVRSYGTQYGSVYLERYSDPLEMVAGKSIELGKPSGSIWLAVPRSQPQLFGFLGIKNFDDFGRTIVDLRNASRARSTMVEPRMSPSGLD